MGVRAEVLLTLQSSLYCLSSEEGSCRVRTGLHPYSLSQPPPLLLELMDKLGIELVLTKSIRIQVYTCSNVLRGHACNSTGHRTGRVQLELVEVKSMRALKCPEGQHCSPQGTALDEFSLDSSAKS